MCVLSVRRKEKQRGCYTLITYIVGISFRKKGYDSKNGVVLCIKCHNEFHRKYGFDALDKPKLLLDYLNGNRIIKEYIDKQ